MFEIKVTGVLHEDVQDERRFWFLPADVQDERGFWFLHGDVQDERGFWFLHGDVQDENGLSASHQQGVWDENEYLDSSQSSPPVTHDSEILRLFGN